jgi:hypothetical protein
MQGETQDHALVLQTVASSPMKLVKRVILLHLNLAL